MISRVTELNGESDIRPWFPESVLNFALLQIISFDRNYFKLVETNTHVRSKRGSVLGNEQRNKDLN